MLAKVLLLKQHLKNVVPTSLAPSLAPKTKWMGVAVVGLMGVAFAAYGIAPDSDVSKSGVSDFNDSNSNGANSARQTLGPSKQITETVLARSATSFASSIPASTIEIDQAISELKPERYLQSERVRKGDSIGALLSRMGAADPELIKFIAKNPIAQPFVKMHIGRVIQAEISSDAKIHALHYFQSALDDEDGVVTPGTRWTITRGEEGLMVRQEAAQLVTYTETKIFSIRSTLAAAADSSKVPESVANQIVDLFSDVIDFEKEARRGDRVKVIYETLADPLSLEAPVPGKVLAVEWQSGKKQYTALWSGDTKNSDRQSAENGEYYSFDGKSLSKSFLRYPIEFARISSEFSESRQHPIFKDWRAHKGVDFAAPLGTKIRATGDGVVSFIGVQRGYGNVVTLTHGKYSTTYAHMNEFSDGLKDGVKVRQGDVIGFVGRTGFATGAHLHYEFKVNGEHADPLTAELPTKGPLDAATKKRLVSKAEQVKGLMAQLSGNKLAQFQ